MITARTFLVSVGIAILASAGMALLHSLEISFYVMAVLSFILGIYWSFLAQKYKQKRLQHTSLAPQKMEKEDELSGGWWEGWLPMVAAVCLFGYGFSYHLAPTGINAAPLLLQTTIGGLCGFIMGLAYPLCVFGLWRKYVVALNLVEPH